jgi:hypothetical protein
MKFATRISSIRRIAWNACRSCSCASSTTCADSLARNRDAGWTRSPAASSIAVTGGCASQSSCTSGWRSRSSAAIATSRRAWPRPIGDDRYSARFGRRAARAQRVDDGRRGATSPTNSWINRLTATGSRTFGPWPPPSTVTIRPPVTSASAAPPACGAMPSSSPWMTSTGRSTRRHTEPNVSA